jgi:hypothetical protein
MSMAQQPFRLSAARQAPPAEFVLTIELAFVETSYFSPAYLCLQRRPNHVDVKNNSVACILNG